MVDDDLSLVLVHGAWGSPVMWHWVVEALGDLADRVVVADLPSSSRPDGTLADDVEHVRSLATTSTTVLCGHSFGGAVISEAAASLPGVAHLVYIAAFAPDVGESTFDWFVKRPIEGEPLQLFDDGTSLPSGWGVDDGKYDAPTLERIRSIALRREAVGALVTALSAAAWHTIPSTYVVAARDSVLHPDTQRELAARAGSDVIEIDVDHMANVAVPGELAQVLHAVVSAL